MTDREIRLPLAAASLLLAAGCVERQVPSLAGCIKERSAELGGLSSPEQLEAVTATCYHLLADQEILRRLAATAGIYEDQLYQNHVLLWIVVIITLSGVLLAGVQLLASYQLAKAGKGTLADGGEVNLAPGNAVVKSSVVGVVILALSLAFFMVFVAEVYKITPAAATAPARSGKSAPAAAANGAATTPSTGAATTTGATTPGTAAARPRGQEIPR